VRDTVLLGGTGFIGRAVVAELERMKSPLRLLVRGTPPDTLPRATFVEGDVLDRAALRQLMTPGCSVINLVTLGSTGPTAETSALRNIAEACLEAGAERLVHCSTATVAGRAFAARIDEDTPCLPGSPYERAKLAGEDELRGLLKGRLPLCIARPTAVFGPGGRNLFKLAESLRTGLRVSNRLRSLLFGKRRMHLVPVRNAAAALAFLATRPKPGDDETFLVSEDDAPENNFQDVEALLRSSLHMAARGLPRAALPPGVLAFSLRVLGRSDADPRRLYDPSRLLRAGFVRPVTFRKGIEEFAAWFAKGGV
jgi:nucleoside-diphosphate-sugar epimerase